MFCFHFLPILLYYSPFCSSQARQESVPEYWIYLDYKDCVVESSMASPVASPMKQMTCPVISYIPSSVTSIASPTTSRISPISSAADTPRSRLRAPSCRVLGPIDAAAHLHLLGESLSLIGHRLQGTMVSRIKHKNCIYFFSCFGKTLNHNWLIFPLVFVTFYNAFSIFYSIGVVCVCCRNENVEILHFRRRPLIDLYEPNEYIMIYDKWSFL